MVAVYRYCANNKTFDTQLKPLIVRVSPLDFMKAALAAGDATAYARRSEDKIDVKVKDLLRSMDIALRGVEGTDAEREIFRLEFGAMRIWNGCFAVSLQSIRMTTGRCCSSNSVTPNTSTCRNCLSSD
jgi:hypothetical protein